MEHKRQIKMLSIIALIVAIAGMSLGFAAFSTTLNISSSASVTPSSSEFRVVFSTEQDSLNTSPVTPSSKTEGLVTTNGTIINGITPTLTNLSATFTAPGQYVTYSVYLRNEGEYTAYLNSLNFLGDKTCIAEPGTTDELVQSACDSISIGVWWGPPVYNNSVSLSNQPIEKGASKQISIRLYYEENGIQVDGPFSITFPSISFVTSTVDDSSIDGKVVRVVSGDINVKGSVVAIGNEQFYVYGNENEKVKLLSMYNLYVGNTIDQNNNVTPLSNPTGIQNHKSIGAIFDETGEQTTGYPWFGASPFSSSNSSYENSVAQNYVNNYKNYINQMGVAVNEARLITHDELTELGCVEWGTCPSDKEWLYNTSYWTQTPATESRVWAIYSTGEFGNASNTKANGLGIRPVIIISETEF